MASNPVTLYAVPHSLYSARARSYLIKAGIPYREVSTSSAHYHKVIKEKAGGRMTVPTAELCDGTVIRDGSAIIDHFEALSNHAFAPDTPKQNVISLLFDVIGAEGLLRPAMHYRWSYKQEQFDFLKHHFRIHAQRGEREEQDIEKTMHRMGNVFGPAFGVSPDIAGTIEAVYLDQLEALDKHFADYGYLLGGRPCIGDFGMIAPLFPHLGRDPVPLALMQLKAMRVYRWTERMNYLASDLCEYENQDETWLADDEIPATLVTVMRAMAEDFVPETLAAADSINEWLDAQENLAPGTACGRSVGDKAQFKLRGAEVSAVAQPYRFYLLKRFQDAYDDLQAEDKRDMDAILAQAGMSDLVNARLSRAIGWKNNLEVWL